jgi:hypothetical protein
VAKVKSHVGSTSWISEPIFVKYKWGEEQQKAFYEIKQKVSQDTLLAFPDFETECNVYTDASKKKLGSVIVQEGKPLACYSRKLSSAQTRYITNEPHLS